MVSTNAPSATATAPLSAADARRALDDARTRDAVFESVLRAMIARAECAAVFTIHGNAARGRLGLGAGGFEREHIIAEIALANAPELAAAASTGAPRIATFEPEDPVAQVLSETFGAPLHSALMLPIQLRSRVVAIAVAGSGDELAMAPLTELLPLATGAADALTRLITAAKRGEAEPRQAPADDGAARPPGRDELEALAAELQAEQRWHELAEVLRQLEAVTPERSRRRAILQRLARVSAERLGVPEVAVELRERAQTLALPTELAELEALCTEYRDTEQWAELADALEAMVERGRSSGSLLPTDIVETLIELAQVEVGQLGNVDRAIDIWQQALAIAPDEPRALEALEPLLASRERWDECAEVVVRRGRAMFASGEFAPGIDALVRAGELLETRLNDGNAALELYREIRSHAPDHPIACERLIEAYRRGDRWTELAEVLLERAQHRDDVHDRVELLREIAAIYEQHLQDPAGAFMVIETALGDDPASPDLARELARLAGPADAWSELALAHEARAAALADDDPDAATAAWLDAARCYRDRCGDLTGAERCVRAALELTPAPAAVAELAEIQRAAGNHAALAETLRHQAELADNDEHRVEHLLAAADVYETELDQPYDAIAACCEALDTDAHSLPALVSLERLYQRHEMWEQLVDALSRAAELRADDEDELLRLKRAIAETLDHKLQERARAVPAYEELLELAPGDVQALRALEDLHEASGSAEAYLDVLERRLDRAQTNDERARLYQRLASVWETDLDRPDRAAAVLEKLGTVDEASADPERHRRLIHLYRQTGDHAALLETYASYLEVLDEPIAQVDALCAMAELCEIELDDPARAIDCYERVLEVDPEEPRALEALAEDAETRRQLDRAIDHLEVLRGITEDPAMRAVLCLRIAKLALDERANPGLGEQRLEEALELAPDNVAALTGLATLAVERKQWQRATELYVRAAAGETSPEAAANLHRHAARIARDELDDPELARDQLAAAVRRAPDELESAANLAALHEQAGDWPALAELLEGVRPAAKAASWSLEAQAELAARAARAATGLGDADAAIRHYDAALAFTPGAPELLNARAEVLYAAEDWTAAAAAYRAVMVHGAGTEDERARIYFRLGSALARAGEPTKAADMLRRCLSIDRSHRDALTALIDLAEAQQDWSGLVDATRELAAMSEGGEHVRLLERVGDLYRERLASAPKALAAYLEGLELAPHDHRLLQRALELHSELEQWQQAIGVIETFLELEDDPLRRAPYHRAAAAICRQKLSDHAAAVDHLERALDAYLADPEAVPERAFAKALEAFREIDEMLTAQRDWKGQEKAYRRMLRRVPQADPKLAVALWDGLGEIYRSRLKLYQSAIEAYGVSHRLAPNPARAVILSELSVVAGPEARDVALDQLDEVLRVSPRQVEPYRSLFAIYREAGDVDAAWCATAALVALGAARPDEQGFCEQRRPRKVPTARQRMSHEMWNTLRAPDEDRYIGALFAAIHDVAAQTVAQPHRAFGLKRKDKIDLDAENLNEPRLIRYVVDALGVPRPELFVQAERPGGLLLANCGERRQLWPALVIRQDFGRRGDREAVFLVARRLAMLRPERFLTIAMPTSQELKVALMAAIVAVRTGFAVPDELTDRVSALARTLREQLPASVLEQLGDLVSRVIERTPKLDVSAWSRGATLTAQRIGLLLCGDLATALRLVEAEPPPAGGGPGPRDDLAQLTAFSVSRHYLAARRQLGLAIG